MIRAGVGDVSGTKWEGSEWRLWGGLTKIIILFRCTLLGHNSWYHPVERYNCVCVHVCMSESLCLRKRDADITSTMMSLKGI